MPTRKAKQHDDDVDETPVDLPEADEPEPPKIDAKLQSLTPAEINQAVAKLVGVDFTTRQSPIGVLCVRGDGTIWSPVDRDDHAGFAARRSGYDYPVGTPPRDVCLGLLSRAK